MKEIYEMNGQGHSARGVARDLGLTRNTVLKYLKSPEAMHPKPRQPRGSKLDPYAEHIDRRMAEGLENCVVLLRELRGLGYDGSYNTVVEYVKPRRKGRQPEAAMRFETAPGEQAQVDWGSLAYDRRRRSQPPGAGVVRRGGQARVHGTTHRVPWETLSEERPHLC